MVMLHVREGNVIEGGEIEVDFGELIGEPAVETQLLSIHISPTLGLGRRQRKSTIPQQAASLMLDHIAGRDEHAHVGLLAGESEVEGVELLVIETDATTIEDVEPQGGGLRFRNGFGS